MDTEDIYTITYYQEDGVADITLDGEDVFRFGMCGEKGIESAIERNGFTRLSEWSPLGYRGVRHATVKRA